MNAIARTVPWFRGITRAEPEILEPADLAPAAPTHVFCEFEHVADERAYLAGKADGYRDQERKLRDMAARALEMANQCGAVADTYESGAMRLAGYVNGR